ncbi:hypothetical protein OJF2_69860 [Aquisphaera giovannonii]|uniref:Uncharacterized protein n=1 Tax=Aquisphaera giovannonii TaxID=406548 RepID=A0A5B9WEA3_9BACT|nr:hypothetical protein [Aquisphaera giovannonii]QEH38385.1 hypothetical protein OJF2_69860 [Aquisphaera giovannonii]
MQGPSILLLLLACGQADEPDEPAADAAAAGQRLTVHTRTMDGKDRTLSLVIPGRAGGNRAGPIRIQDAILNPENFDRWLFDAEDAATPRARLLARLDAWVEAAARENGLDGTQAARLRLAGKGDIARFLDEVEEKRKEFDARRGTFREGYAALRDLGPMTKRYEEGPFGGGSLFAKTLGKIQAEAGLPRRFLGVPPAAATKAAGAGAAGPAAPGRVVRRLAPR